MTGRSSPEYHESYLHRRKSLKPRIKKFALLCFALLYSTLLCFVLLYFRLL